MLTLTVVCTQIDQILPTTFEWQAVARYRPW